MDIKKIKYKFDHVALTVENIDRAIERIKLKLIKSNILNIFIPKFLYIKKLWH